LKSPDGQKDNNMNQIREYLTTQILTSDDNDAQDVAEALLVLHDEGLLDTSVDEMTGEPLFAIKEDVTEEDWETARDHYDSLRDADEDGWVHYLTDIISVS